MNIRALHGFSRKLASMLLVSLLISLSFVFIAWKQRADAASAPNIISYQGRLLNANGVPLSNASVNMIFELYDASAAGTCVWSNSSATCASATARAVTLTDGLFSENLGDTGSSYAAISDSIFGNNAALYLQITVEGETLTPRKQIVSAPYALNSDTLDGLDADTDGSTASAIAAFNSSGALVITGNPGGSGVSQGSLYINPASADTAANDSVLGVAVEGSEIFRIDKEGDTNLAGTLTIGAGQGVDTSAAGSLALGGTNATSLSICNSAACDTITVATNADADTVTIGDASDDVSITDANWSISGAGAASFTSISATTTGATSFSGDIDMATNLILNIGDNGTDFVAGGGLTLAGTLTSNGSFVANGSVTLGDASGDTVLSNADAWTFANDTAVTLSGGVNGLNFDSNTLSIDATNDRVGIGTAAPSAPLEIQKNSLGTTSTDGLLLQNTTAAAAGAQQYSPRIHLIGQGWKTDATAGSQTVDWISQLAPIESTAATNGAYEQKMQINGGGYVRTMLITYAPSTTVNGAGNTFMGYNAGSTNYSGGALAYNNTFIGGESGQNNTSGYQNTFVGSRSGNQNTTGFENTGIGQGALYWGATVSNNVGVGFHAGLNATGGDNVFVGRAAGEGASSATATGTGNVFIGYLSGGVYTTATQNVGVGRYTMQAVTSGNQNAALGGGAGFSNTTGGNNVYVGFQAGYTATGSNANVTGSGNTYVGFQAGPGTTTQLSNAMALGNGALVTASNSVVIGNTSVTQQTMNGGLAVNAVLTSSGTQKILNLTNVNHTGQTASTEISNIKSSAYTRTWATGAISNQREVFFGTPTYAFAGASTISNAANVYIENAPQPGTNATITNAYALWVDDGITRFDGAVSATSTLTVTSTFTANGTTALGDGGDTVAVDSSDWDITATGDMSGIGSLAADGDVDFSFNTAGSQTENLTITSTHASDNDLAVVDISQTDSAAASTSLNYLLRLRTLDDGGATGMQDSMMLLSNLDSNESIDSGISFSGSAGFTNAIDASDSSISNSLFASDNFILYNTIRTAELSSGTLTFETTGGSDLATLVNNAGTGNFFVTGGLFVAAGSGLDTSAAGVLTLAGTNATSLALCSSTNCDTLNIATGSDTDIIAIGDSTGADQIAILSGATTEDVTTITADSLTTGKALLVTRADGASDYDGNLVDLQMNETSLTSDSNVLKITNLGGGNGAGIYIVQDTVDDSTAQPAGQALVIDVNEAANSDEVILIRSDADGTPDTEFRFENDGNFYADGAAYNTPADFAEFFYTVDSELQNSHVVCRDPSTEKGVKRCEANNTNVLGVVSPTPAFVGNHIPGAEGDLRDDPNYRIVGLLGQVDTYVTADDGAIKVGDPITTSSTTAGYAGKVRGPAQIIGFALEPLSAGRGLIKVLVQPQWYGGDILARDGSAMTVSGGVKLSALEVATAANPIVNSNALSLVGSVWNGTAAQNVSMGVRTRVSGLGSYRLAVENELGGEVAAFTNSGDLMLSGKLYPSDRGIAQNSAYIFYDSSVGGGYMKTNAAGWNVGSYDFAEMFPSADVLETGEVVVFGGNAENVARSSGNRYDDRIAGVVSTRPGFLAGEYKAGSYPIALAGRVPTLVNTENGAIHVGDPLTTSSKPGYAMKATEPGPILGYAMENLENGEGKVVVFIRASYYDGNGTNVAPAATNTVSGLSTNLSALNVTGVLNMNGGNILSVANVEGVGGSWKIAENGDFTTRGKIIEQVVSHQGEIVDTYATMSREMTIELTGTTTLEGGRAVVTFEDIDEKFNDIISTTAPYRVLVTPSGITGQVYVTDRSTNGFTIRDSGSSTGVAVDWLVIAYHKDYEPIATSQTQVPEAETGATDPIVEEIVADNGTETVIPEVGEVAGETTETPLETGSTESVSVEGDGATTTDSVPVTETTSDATETTQTVDETLSTSTESEIMSQPQEVTTPMEETPSITEGVAAENGVSQP